MSPMSIRREVALVFPGQGAQQPRMGADLYGVEPTFTEVMDDFFAAGGAEGPRLRADWLSPQPGPDFDDCGRAQPLLFAVGAVLALCEKWEVNGTAIGTVTEGNRFRVLRGEEVVGDMPVTGLVDDAPLYDLAPEKPAAGLYPAPAATLGFEADVRELGAAYLGGRSLAAFVTAGLAEERVAGTGMRAAAAFGWPVAPLCSWTF